MTPLLKPGYGHPVSGGSAQLGYQATRGTEAGNTDMETGMLLPLSSLCTSPSIGLEM